jgi:hypothetical protein
MTQALVSELVAIIRRSREDPGRPLARALGRALEGGGFACLAAEVEEVARRARAFDATDEELSLSIGAVLAMSHGRTGTP